MDEINVTTTAVAVESRSKALRYILVGALALAAWFVIYKNLLRAARWMTYDLLRLEHGRHLSEAAEFFLYDTPKVMMLLTLIVFGVGVLRSFFTPERTRSLLAGRNEAAGITLAALLGIVAPFCTCSSVPLFVGFVAAGVPLGVTFSFLVASPIIDEVALVMLFGLFGWKIAALYLTTGLCIAISAGWIIGRLRMERHVADWVYQQQAAQSMGQGALTWAGRVDHGLCAVRDIVRKVWIYVIVGIAVGAGIHGYVPENFMVSIMGKSAWWAVPVAVLMGVPMYSNAAGIIPIVQALLSKGAALGTVLAFMMAVIGMSLPEAVMLRNVLKPRLIAVFFGVVALGILIVGYLFNIVI